MDNLIKEVQNAKLTPTQNDALVTFVTHHIAPILNENKLLNNENELLKMKIYRLEFYTEPFYFRAKNENDLARKIIEMIDEVIFLDFMKKCVDVVIDKFDEIYPDSEELKLIITSRYKLDDENSFRRCIGENREFVIEAIEFYITEGVYSFDYCVEEANFY